MNLAELQKKHRKFVYEKYTWEVCDGYLSIRFFYKLTPNIEFAPLTKIPVHSIQLANIDNFIFNLGLVEMISYYKAALPKTIYVRAGQINKTQEKFFTNLILNGLGEFYYTNKINFKKNGIPAIISETNPPLSHRDVRSRSGDLILIGGGKDSAVTIESLKHISTRSNVLMVNPTKAALETARVAGFNKPIIVYREIDKKLMDLNSAGYLNGHTPFSAYLSFLSLLVAQIYGYKNIIVSNEQSAGEANLNYMGLKVNHQYSKSYTYERKFRDYVKKFLSADINYFSYLRPLSELQIAALFSRNKKYDLAFNSCNISRGEFWCGKCAKCAFVYIILYPFLNEFRRKNIFKNRNFLEDPDIIRHIKDLTGKGLHKPLECVGTEQESRLAMSYINNNNIKEIKQHIQGSWDNRHFLPHKYEAHLRRELKSIKL